MRPSDDEGTTRKGDPTAANRAIQTSNGTARCVRSRDRSSRITAYVMSHKRKREEEPEGTFAEHNNGLSRPTQEIVKYFEELRQHFDSLDDKEEQSLLVTNALDEANGQESAVAADPGCSRVLEVLLPAAEPQHVAKFFRAVLKGDAGLLALASRSAMKDCLWCTIYANLKSEKDWLWPCARHKRLFCAVPLGHTC